MPELLADPLPPMRVTPRQGLVRRVHHGPEVSQLLRAQHVRPRSLILGQSFASCGNPMKSSTHYGDSRMNASPRRNYQNANLTAEAAVWDAAWASAYASAPGWQLP
jgi:hypothetical protein